MDRTGKIYKKVEEKEIAIKLEITHLAYNNMMCLFESLKNTKKITKLSYSTPKGYRVIYGTDYTNKQIKIQRECYEDFLYYKNKFIFAISIKKSSEETLSNSCNFDDDNNLESSVQRHYFFENKIRFALEKKFSSKYQYQQPTQTNDNMKSVLNIDKWVRLASQTFLHIEYEYDGDTKQAISYLQKKLETSALFEKIIEHLMIVCNNISLNTLIENKLDTFSRNFATTLTEKPLYIAWKLDGIRKSCIIHQDTLIIDGVKVIVLSKEIVQPIKCHIEIIDGKYYIIDILEIWGPNNVYIKPDHLQAIKIIQSKFIQQLTTEHLATNKYYKPGAMMPYTDIKNDGLLMYTTKQIIKNKEHTVDLILLKPIIKREKKIKTCKFNDVYGTSANMETQLVKHHCIGELLMFADKTTFTSAFPGWTIDLVDGSNNSDLQTSTSTLDNGEQATKFIDNIFNNHNNKLSVTNFIILEFKIDYNNKKIHFLKKRPDKMQANTPQAMLRMFDY